MIFLEVLSNDSRTIDGAEATDLSGSAQAENTGIVVGTTQQTSGTEVMQDTGTVSDDNNLSQLRKQIAANRLNISSMNNSRTSYISANNKEHQIFCLVMMIISMLLIHIELYYQSFCGF